MDSRLKKALLAGGRETRASEDSDRKSLEFASTQDIDQMWSDEWTQSALPKVPLISGWHLCWLSTTNTYDTIDKRIRLGYVPVLADELPGFENYRVKSGEHVGHISCNVMLLFKLPMDVYQKVMTRLHWTKPREEAEKIKVQVDNLHARDSSGKTLLSPEGQGIDNLDRQFNQAPVFEG